ncbi:tRNA 5-methoxyuridine(34)/uridine 5-oxyacetic acid(34) synthase CmoB [uncultured Umboniibacter sp.]|uniref:tRNA 5-methoxyuridine(34)/uridine 5-oxyacetic acid(34) synthase CmoB n=1 Tax=uncultured Umboniibacter sp. TaxID=1798917 RepID=UPI002630D625|nr:tRNA 5-methoxyuridine(34)/uridine 5-oxyacetic acid(34) synthase CmoB [uncultured Umboniibacter sp.]
MIDFNNALKAMSDAGIPPWNGLAEQLSARFNQQRYGDLPRWLDALDQLPDLPVDTRRTDLDTVTINGSEQIDLREQLMQFHPWRKGPFSLFGTHIDTEWRSDWKWQRLISYLSPLSGRKVLDIGCGSGYHCWRSHGAGAAFTLGIDPTPLFNVQFRVLQKYLEYQNVQVLPLGIEDLPAKLHCFDTTFSMGVLYHRKSPIDHLIELRDTLRPGGELVLETLVVDGPEGYSLVPSGRYARMGNVWFLPSVATLTNWLEKVRFKNVKVVDLSVTSTEEQRTTEWMTYHSLANFLDPEDSTKTLEGYPAPKRAVIIAEAPTN